MEDETIEVGDRPGTPPLPIPFGTSSSGTFPSQATSSGSTANRSLARRPPIEDLSLTRSSLSINVVPM